MKVIIINRALCVGIAAALALSISGTAAAQKTLDVVHVHTAAVNPISLLAQASKLTPRQVQMVLGARTSFPGYVASYDFVEKQLQQAVGPKIYQDLRSQGELSSQDVLELTAMVNTRHAEHVASK